MKYTLLLSLLIWYVLEGTVKCAEVLKTDQLSYELILNKLQKLDKPLARALSQPETEEYSNILLEYGKMLYYGNYTAVEGSFPKAYAFFKLAAEHGNVESHFYLGLMTFFQIDGNFIMQTNHNKFYKDKYAYLRDYITKSNVTKTALNIYIASLQDHLQSSYVLANFYSKGVIMEKKCSSSALYLKRVSDYIFSQEQWEENYNPTFVDKHRLDKEFFGLIEVPKDKDYFINDSPEELEYIRMSAELGKISYLVHLANVYLYGLRGQARDYKKAFQYYSKASQLGEVTAKTQVGVMYIRGLGVDVDYKKAFSYLNEAALRNDPRAKNGLGYLYMNGLGVPTDTKEALKYFLEAANANVTDAQYNYGVLLRDKGSGNQEQNRKISHQYINYASVQGHLLAQYHLGLSYLEGTDIYYSCDLATRLLHAACDRGPWSELLRAGYQAFRVKNYRLAFAIYLETAFLGYEAGYVNAAIILDKFYTFQKPDISYQTVSEMLDNDVVYKTLKKSHSLSPPEDIRAFLYQDYLEAIHDFNTQQERIAVLDNLLNINKESNFSQIISKNTMLHLYRRMAEEDEPFSLFRIAESYRTGDVLPQNFTLAFDNYRQLVVNTRNVQINSRENAHIFAQSYYFLGYMRHYGLGIEKNLSKAIFNYNTSILINANSGLLARYMKTMAQLELDDSKLLTLYNMGNVFNIQNESLTSHFYESFNAKAFETLPFYVLSLCLVGLLVLRIRLYNYVDIFLSNKH